MPTFPHAFDYSFGYDPSMSTVAGTSLALDLTHVERAKSRLLTQFKDKPRLEAVVEALVRQVQHLEVASWQLLVEQLLSTAAGTVLDSIGGLVGVTRPAGWNDDEMRARVRVEILVLRSRGTAGDLVGIVRGYENDENAPLELDPRLPCEMAVVLGFESTGLRAFDLARLLRRAKPAGHRLTVEYLTQSTASTLAFSSTLSGWEPDEDATGFGWSGDAALGGQLAGVTE